jgi:DNA-binding CsgD family transcriptional regulator/PAS domain-containing protein
MPVVPRAPRPNSVGGSSESVPPLALSRAVAPQPDDAQHLERLERAVTVALSPLDYADATAWGDALTAALCALADTIAGTYALPGAPVRWRAVSYDEATNRSTGCWRLHDEASERVYDSGTRDLVLWARDDLAVGNTQHPSPASAGGTGTVGLRVRTTDGAVAAVCIHRDPALGAAPHYLLAALRAIAPAFRAGVGAWTRSIASRANVARVLDSLAEPALMFDVRGTLLHANPAADRLTSTVDTTRLEAEAQRVAWALGAITRRRSQARSPIGRAAFDAPSEPQSVRRLQIGAVVYCLRGSMVGEQLLGAEPAVLVTVTTTTAKPITDDTLRTEFGLTAREIEVARLMAEGLSNSEIAARLGVKFFTARNHVERTLAKLGVSSRHRVGPLLRNELSEAVAA